MTRVKFRLLSGKRLRVFSKSHTSYTRTASFTRRMAAATTRSASFTRRTAAPTTISTTNHYTKITQKIQKQYLHMHNKSNLTTKNTIY